MDEYELLKLGSLLHDVGKVVQRDTGKTEDHSELGYKFLKGWGEDIARFARFHHKSKIDQHKSDIEKLSVVQQNLLWMVYEADNLSSAERMEMEGKFNPQNPLISIFSIVKIKKEVDERKIKVKAYPLTTFDFDSFVFPGFEKDRTEDKIQHKSYEEIYDDFKHKFPFLYPDLILAFLERETTFIPARTGEDEDISLFDHLKTTSAIASCMYLYHRNELDRDIKDKILDRTEDKYLLISGDISGIQKFIYNITSKGALKLLRARSFYLEMISEDFVQELLDELNLSRANLLYCAGGHFYILAPDTEECKSKVNNLKRKLNEWLLKKYEGSLYYAVDYAHFEGVKFKDFSKIWADIGKRVSEEKSKKFREFLVEAPDRFLREDVRDEDYLKKKECKACKRFVSEDKIKIDIEKEVEYCDVCDNLKNKVGTKLVKNNKYIFRFKETDACDLELPFSKIKITDKMEKNHFNTFFQINSFDIPVEVLELRRKIDFTFVPLALGTYSCEKDLDTLAKDSKGIKKIGILRMDVDNLGRIFREGLPKELRTISRVTNLSRFLNYFFKGYINLLGEFEEKNVRGICNSVWDGGRLKARKNRDFSIVYAGGDDLLIAGAWDDVFELAFDIHALFRRYVGENDNITISASFCLFDPKFPFYKMAEISGIKEEKAKDEGKNRIWMFDRGIKKEFEERYGFKESIGWEKFLEVWKDFNSLQKNGVSKRAITKLLNISSISNLYKESPDKVSWAMNLAYWYGKLEENEKKYFDKIIRKYSIITVKQPSEIYYIDVPLRILDFTTRGE